MDYPVLTDGHLDEEIALALRALRPGPILRGFFLHWAILGAFIGFGSVWASEKTWSAFHPSVAWIMTTVLGSGLVAAGPAAFRVWSLRRYLTRTNEELREQLEKDWSVLTRQGWVGRLARFSVATSAGFGILMGALFSILFPDDRLFGSTLGTMGTMMAMFLVPIPLMVFGGRALLVRRMIRRSEGGPALEQPEESNGE